MQELQHLNPRVALCELTAEEDDRWLLRGDPSLRDIEQQVRLAVSRLAVEQHGVRVRGVRCSRCGFFGEVAQERAELIGVMALVRIHIASFLRARLLFQRVAAPV